MKWAIGQEVTLAECDPATGKPKPGGRTVTGTVADMDNVDQVDVVAVDAPGLPPCKTFLADTGLAWLDDPGWSLLTGDETAPGVGTGTADAEENHPGQRTEKPTQAYAYPRTAAEMIPVRRAEIEAHAHEVPSCQVHGPMEPRQLEGQTYEQLFCGVWYDCKGPRCGSSAVFASRDLAYQNGEPYYDGARYWKHDGVTWRQVSKAEAEEFFAPKQAEHDAVLRRMAARVGKPVQSLYADTPIAGDLHENGGNPVDRS